MVVGRKKQERRTRAAPAGPAKGLERTAPGRRPLRGVAGAASFKTPRAGSPRLAGSLEAVTHAHAWIKLSTGLVRPVIALVRISGAKRERGVGTAPALIICEGNLSKDGRQTRKLLGGGGRRKASVQRFVLTR